MAVGFRILWKITAMFTLHQQTPTNSISISMFSRVKTNSNQLQPTPTGVTHWSNKLQQTSLLEFVGVCLCGVNWPIGWMCTHTSNTHLCSTTWKMNFASDDPFKTHSQCLQLTNVTTVRGAVPRSQWTASNHRRCYGNLHLLIWNIFTWALWHKWGTNLCVLFYRLITNLIA